MFDGVSKDDPINDMSVNVEIRKDKFDFWSKILCDRNIIILLY